MPTYKITFEPMNRVVEADPALYPYSRHGLPGSILDIALGNGVQIEHACGGAGICGTCRVEVEQGVQNLSEATDDEMDTIDQQPGGTLNSRLACQAVLRGDVTVRLQR